MKTLLLIASLMTTTVMAKGFDRAHFDSSVEAIKKNANVELSEEEIYKAAVAGVLQHLESKHRPLEGPPPEAANTLLSPRTVAELKKDLEGEVTGIGIVLEYDPIEKKQRYPLITKVVQQGGAKAAGVMADDEILAIDSKPIREFGSFREMVYALRGKVGSTVQLSLLRGAGIKKVQVKRTVIPYEPVAIEEGPIPTLAVNYFNKKTVGLMKKKLQGKKRVQGLVLDLRQCGGGGLAEGVEALELFSRAGQTMLQMASREGTKTYRAESAGPFASTPLAVMISKETRSMCEAFAYALRATRDAVILGEPSHGKATVESLYEVGDGYSAKITIGQLQGPDGKTWQVAGVQPDVQMAPDQAVAAARKFLSR